MRSTSNPKSAVQVLHGSRGGAIALGAAIVIASLLGGCEAAAVQAPVTPADPIASAPLVVPPARPAPLSNVEFLEQYASTYRFRSGTPVSITPTPDGKAVLFLRSGPRNRVQDLYEFDVATGMERVLLTAEQILGGGEEHLTAEELARRERMRLSSRGITSFGLSKDGTKLLVPLSGKLFVIDRATAKTTEIKSDAGFPIDPRFSPDASKVAVVRDGDLYVDDLANASESRLTTKSKPTITNGLAEFVAQEEMDRFRGYWWSPDNAKIAFEEADTKGLETFTIADPVHPESEAQTWPYPRPGKPNAKVKLFVTVSVPPMDNAPARLEITWDHAKYEYLANVKWSKNAPLTLVVMNREQTEVALLEANPETGDTSVIHVEKDPAWINLDPAVPAWTRDGNAFLWTTERDGAMALEIRAKDGTLIRTLAGKPDGFMDLAHFDAESGVAFLAVADDVKQTHVARLDIEDPSGKPVRLTTGASVNGISIGESLASYVLSSSDLLGNRRWVVYSGDGPTSKPTDVKNVGELTSVGEAPKITPRIELTAVPGSAAGRTFNAAILRPRDFDPKKKYPVILSVYAGPHVTVVHATSWMHLLNQWFADQGFVVAMLDGRGTPRKGREWERSIKNDLITIPLADQVDGLKALGAKYPEMDLSRVGVYGWSFGGYFSAMAAMQRPDVFKAACAGAPVCDWHDYDTCYTERYLGVPDLTGDTNPAAKRAYDVSNVLTYAKDLSVPLLLIHGTADDNVYFMHSLKMADVMFKNGRDYDFLVLPGFTHMVPDPVVTKSLYSRVATFFQRELGEAK